MPKDADIKSLDEILHRSVSLDDAIIRLLEPETYQTFEASDRISASFSACAVSLEHSRGLRALANSGERDRSFWLIVTAAHEVVLRG